MTHVLIWIKTLFLELDPIYEQYARLLVAVQISAVVRFEWIPTGYRSVTDSNCVT